MSFLAPLALWFALSIPALVLLHLLKRRHRTHPVPSTVLWDRHLADTRAQSPWQRLRAQWLLLLQILLLALAVLALARPLSSSTATPSPLRVLILDASASMQSTDVLPSRFEAARAEAHRWVQGLGPHQTLAILQAGPGVLVRQAPTSDRTALRRALDACQVTDGPARIGDALRLAESLIRNVEGAEIHLFSDGALAGLDASPAPALPAVFHPVGVRRRNVAFTSLEVRPHPENPAQRTLLASLVNLTPDPVETSVTLAAGTENVAVRTVSLDAGASASVVFNVTPWPVEVFTVRHDAPDDLAVDNHASVVSPPPVPARILLATRGNAFLQRAILASGPVALTVVQDFPDTPDSPDSPADWDIVILDGLTPSPWPSANLLAIAASPPDWFDQTEPVSNPAIVDWQAGHPVLRFVGLDAVAIAKASTATLPPWGNALIDTPQGPVAFAGQHRSQRILWLGFDLLDTTWPLRVSFPVFIANAIQWLHPHAARSAALNIRAGEPIRLQPPQSAARLEIQPPGEDWQEVPYSPGAPQVAYARTDRQGLYRFRWPGGETTVAVQAIDPVESDTTPRPIPWQTSAHPPVAASALPSAPQERWRGFAAAALAILLLEAWFQHRRT
ncbi:MAG: BatA and WFA domain-containing protein [Verrucomicrobiae bacterium]|nr:BatA and WFA domain-containing protein [Verrucomicrobiae bacterium]